MLPACLVADFIPLSLIHEPPGNTLFSPPCPLPSFTAPYSLVTTNIYIYIYIIYSLLTLFTSHIVLFTAIPAQAKPYLLLLTPISFLFFYSTPLRLFFRRLFQLMECALSEGSQILPAGSFRPDHSKIW